jgi:hypothetical protein
VLRAAEATETTQDNSQGWLQLLEGDLGFQLLTEEEIGAVIFLFISILTIYIIEYYIYLLSNFLWRHEVAKLLEIQCYKPDGRGLDSR